MLKHLAKISVLALVLATLVALPAAAVKADSRAPAAGIDIEPGG